MKTLVISFILAGASFVTHSQSGAPSPEGQTITPQGEAAASSAVQGRHDRLIARRAAKAAKKASAASS